MEVLFILRLFLNILVGWVVFMVPLSETRVFKMGLLTPWNLSYDFNGYTSASAVTIAMEKVRSDPSLNANGQIELRYDACCSINTNSDLFLQ